MILHHNEEDVVQRRDAFRDWALLRDACSRQCQQGSYHQSLYFHYFDSPSIGLTVGISPGGERNLNPYRTYG
jgi:hypothetical protein